jgi:hypothetical protein
MKMHFARAIFVLGMAVVVSMGAEPKVMRSGGTRTSVLELYTSEGCSSCPPAERWLSSLTENPRLWKDMVAVSFHVDYWDDLGWKDPLARPEFSARQRNYSTEWRANAVYTPGFVLDGKEWKGWYQREALPMARKEKVGTLSATSSGVDGWSVSFEPLEMKVTEKVSFSGALLGFGMSLKVHAGENGGRTLKHDFVVLKFETAPGKVVGKSFETTMKLPANLKADAKRRAVVFWATKAGSLQPVQAVGDWIVE